MGPIPFLKIVDYADWAGIEDIIEFVNIIQFVDSRYIEMQMDRAENAAKINNGKR